MSLEFTLAQNAVALVGPFLPYLDSVGRTLTESMQKKLTEVIAENGGTVVWETAKKVWNKINGLFQGNRTAEAKITLAANESEVPSHLVSLVKELEKRLAVDGALVREFQALLEGNPAVQKMIAGNRGWIIASEQEMASTGEQIQQVGEEGLIERGKQRQGFSTPLGGK